MPTFFARKSVVKTREGDLERFVDISTHLEATRQYGDGPYFRISLEETENHSPQYWGWKTKNGEYEFIHCMRAGVDICFPYGTKIEEEKGEGKIVGLELSQEENA